MAAPPTGEASDSEERIAQIQAAIAAQESLRPTLGDAVVDLTITALRRQLAEVEAERLRSAADAARTDRQAERKPVSILFANLVGFTSLSERTDPETARRLMNNCFDALKAVVDHYGGHVDKYIGDEIMVLFGAPVAYEDHAERALRAALEMRPALQSFNEQMAGDPQLAALPPEMRTLAMHVGINSGLVIAGGIGAQDLQQYSVVGDAVNVASRLTDLSQPGQVLVGEATYQLTAPLFDFAPLPSVTLKGKQEPQ